MKTRYAWMVVALAIQPAACSDTTGPDGSDGSDGAETFEWTGQVASNGAVEIKGINGAIRAVRASGQEIRVAARKRGQRDDPSSVTIDVVEHPGGVTVCAVYPDVPGHPRNVCLPGLLQGHLSSRNNDVEVTFELRVPAGLEFRGGTIGGDITAVALDGDVVARTMSGDIDVSTTGWAVGATISGDITASIGLADWERDLSFSSMSGDISVRIPSSTNARVSATARGIISTDFPLAITGQGLFRHMSGTLGSGGRNLTMTTSDGNIVLRSN